MRWDAHMRREVHVWHMRCEVHVWHMRCEMHVAHFTWDARGETRTWDARCMYFTSDASCLSLLLVIIVSLYSLSTPPSLLIVSQLIVSTHCLSLLNVSQVINPLYSLSLYSMSLKSSTLSTHCLSTQCLSSHQLSLLIEVRRSHETRDACISHQTRGACSTFHISFLTSSHMRPVSVIFARHTLEQTGVSCSACARHTLQREVGGWGRDPKKCTGRDRGMGSSTI